MDVFMIVMSCIIFGMLCGVNVYLIIYYHHPDDKKNCSAWIAWIFGAIGMTLAWGQVLLLPLDVANSS